VADIVRAMRVAYLVSQYPAASHTFISREVAAVRAGGCEVHTFSVRPPAEDEIRSSADHGEYASTTYLLPVRAPAYLAAHCRSALRNPRRYLATLRLALRHRVPGARAFVYAFVYFAEAGVLAEHLRRRRVERLHNHFANAGAIVGMLAARLAGLPWSLTLHGISETDYPAGNLLAAKIEAADAVACVSQFGRAQAFRLVDPSLWPKLRIVRCGIDLDGLPDAQPDARAPVRLICVGRLSPEKGHVGLIAAYASVARALPPSRLILVGDGPERSAIEELIERLGVGDIVELRGRLPETETLEAIAESDVLVLASFMEGLPVVLMEALAFERPVVAPRVAGVPELVEDGRHGLLFAPGDWMELAAHLRRIVGDDALRGRMGAGGRARATALCDVRRSAEDLVAMWRAADTTDGPLTLSNPVLSLAESPAVSPSA
jgi:glycosyltransferase involved in cell wall biosynthesis